MYSVCAALQVESECSDVKLSCHFYYRINKRKRKKQGEGKGSGVRNVKKAAMKRG